MGARFFCEGLGGSVWKGFVYRVTHITLTVSYSNIVDRFESKYLMSRISVSINHQGRPSSVLPTVLSPTSFNLMKFSINWAQSTSAVLSPTVFGLSNFGISSTVSCPNIPDLTNFCSNRARSTSTVLGPTIFDCGNG